LTVFMLFLHRYPVNLTDCRTSAAACVYAPYASTSKCPGSSTSCGALTSRFVGSVTIRAFAEVSSSGPRDALFSGLPDPAEQESGFDPLGCGLDRHRDPEP